MISVDGILLQNKPLSNVETQDAMRKLGVSGFRGVFVRDNLPSKPRRNECGILNLDDRDGNGTHWVAWHKKNGENTTSIVTESNRHGRWYNICESQYFTTRRKFNLREK